MERSNLEALVASQKEQLSRYEKRLKDVVTAYKGLLKEKEALETSFAAITGDKESPRNDAKTSSATATNTAATNAADAQQTVLSESATTDSQNNLQVQLMTLMNSLATLSAEKSRMEASFQADKKQLRAQLAQKDESIAELQAKIKENQELAKSNVDEVKAKWIIERQEREKETNNQMLMIRELQKLYADERHLKENIEMQLNNFKTQFASSEAENNRLHELQTQLKDTKAQLKQLKSNAKNYAAGDEVDNAVLKQVQQEMHQLKEQHAVALLSEQKRALIAEEQSKKQAALHEDRVANLEARLAELSNTVGSYDRLRQQDQESIHTLKRKLQELECCADVLTTNSDRPGGENDALQRSRKRSVPMQDMAAVVDEIMHLKKLLIIENARSENPIDISKVFAVGADHMQCQEEHKDMQQQLEASKNEIEQLQEKNYLQKTHISTLQEKVKVLNRDIDEQENELKQQTEKLRLAVREERNKWKATITELENECRCRVNELEQQLQKQRQRSLQLLEEKEHEIKNLQTSFEDFHNVAMPMLANNTYAANETEKSSDAESNDDGNIHTAAAAGGGALTAGVSSRIKVKSKKLSVGDSCHMLHYANEIARKDIEIAGLRKSKYAAETSLRKAIQEKVTAQEELSDKIATLEEEVDRLERSKTREGANLEYLKNVIISFIVTKDADGKRHMMNAISAVLQFTPTEISAINAAFHKK